MDLKSDGTAHIGFIWVRIGTSGGLFGFLNLSKPSGNFTYHQV
jgi:hypothetical protein